MAETDEHGRVSMAGPLPPIACTVRRSDQTHCPQIRPNSLSADPTKLGDSMQEGVTACIGYGFIKEEKNVVAIL